MSQQVEFAAGTWTIRKPPDCMPSVEWVFNNH